MLFGTIKLPPTDLPIAASLFRLENNIKKKPREKSQYGPPCNIPLDQQYKCTYVEKTPRKFQFGKKSAKVYHCLYSSTEQLQVAL
ncbi:MAG: hypothetical protein ACK55Z_30775 [bacterium]